MRSLSFPLAAATLIAAPAAAQQAPVHTSKPIGSVAAASARCNPGAAAVDYRGKGTSPKKLGEMPPANQIYTVYTRVDDCPQPIVVRKGIGANPHLKTSPTRSPPRTTKID